MRVRPRCDVEDGEARGREIETPDKIEGFLGDGWPWLGRQVNAIVVRLPCLHRLPRLRLQRAGSSNYISQPRYRLPKHVHDQLLAEVVPVDKNDQGEPLFLEAHVDSWLADRYGTLPGRSCSTIREVAQQGRKRVGDRVWTGQEFCQFFEITNEDLQAWIAQGLKVRQCLDGSMRITETASNDFNRGRVIESPYLNTEEAAKYLRTTVKGVYSLLERRKLKKLPGSRTVLFTYDVLDAYLRGGDK